MRARTFPAHLVFFLLAGAMAAQAQVIPNCGGASPCFVTIIPHSAAGGGFITRMLITNLTNSPNALTINRIDQNGLVVISTNPTLPAGGILELVDLEVGIGPVTINWFAIGSQGSITASVLFDFDGSSRNPPVNFSTAVGALGVSFDTKNPNLTAFTAPVRAVCTPGTPPSCTATVGIALANVITNGLLATIQLSLLDKNGNFVAQDSINLGAFAQTAFALQDRPAFQGPILSQTSSSGEFLGVLEITVTSSPNAIPSPSVAGIVVGNNVNQLFSLPLAAGVAKTPPLMVTAVMKNISFIPNTITIPAGTTVIWDNQDLALGAPHSATGNGLSFDTGVFDPGEKRSITFSTPGTIPYHCTVHPVLMTGTIIVQ